MSIKIATVRTQAYGYVIIMMKKLKSWASKPTEYEQSIVIKNYRTYN